MFRTNSSVSSSSERTEVRSTKTKDLAVTISQGSKLYPPDQYALKDINLDISQGDFIFIAGASGAGKSTLLKILLGSEKFSSGDALVLGRNMKYLNRKNRTELRKELGVIFQDYKLLESRTVLENVAFNLEVRGVAKETREKVAYQLLASLGLRDKVHNLPQTLSGGEQQRVAVARALITKPKLILADEPTGNLDPDMTYAVFNLLLEANKCGATVIVASHNISLIEELNRRTLVLDKGRLVGDFSKVRE